MKKVLILAFSVLSLQVQGQVYLSKAEIEEDLDFLLTTLEQNSSYAYLNGYDFKKDFENYKLNLSDSMLAVDFGLFLTEVIGQIGDRHASVGGYRLDDQLFLPFTYAPLGDKVVILDKTGKDGFNLLLKNYPYLSSVQGISIEDFLAKIRPRDASAPDKSYFTRSVRDLRDIEKAFRLLEREMPQEIKLTLSGSTSNVDTTIIVKPVSRRERLRPWDEAFEQKYLLFDEEDYNQPEIYDPLFHVKDEIAYALLPAMVDKEDAPELFGRLNEFMKEIKSSSKALIIDVRSNRGGTRDLMYELAKYLVHPDSVHVINVSRQRGDLPLSKNFQDRLNIRYLHTYSDYDSKVQSKINDFNQSFIPMYKLSDQKFSEFYYGVFDGVKLSEPGFYYEKPVYILANEKTFSAASILVAAFKGIPNVFITGVTSDGSSGNSDWIDLPNSEFYVRVSTMVSFQKDGKILDGFGTDPDIRIERNMDQLLWKKDHQLNALKNHIHSHLNQSQILEK